MLEEFRVDNYKSLINVTFRPREQNLLLGVNNAGKTNLCQAMSFLSGTTELALAHCASAVAWGTSGLKNFFFDKPTIDFEAKASLPFADGGRLAFRYALSVSLQERSSSLNMQVERESLRVTGGGLDDVLLLENVGGDGRILRENGPAAREPSYSAASVSRELTLLNTLFDAKTSPRAMLFKEYLKSWHYYDLSLPALRASHHYPNRPVLRPDGSNLASVIYQQKTANERFYRLLLDNLKKVDPWVELINFQVPAENRVFMFFEDTRGNAIPALNAPGGVLRFLALLYVLLGQPPAVPTTLRIIEEPENGIYVGYLKDLLAAAEETQPAPQVIFTSHSPYFIDLFDRRLDGVFVLKRGQRHSTLTQPDVEQVEKRLDKFPLGEQHFREMLG